MASGPGPLAGIRVVAFEQAVAMPYCTFLLGELGAEIIKVERLPGGDVIRGWDDRVGGLSTGYVWVNANKRSVALNLKSDDGRKIIRSLIGTADVFVENFAPGVVDRLGIGFEEARKLAPAIVYCSLSGYGQTGPYAGMKAFDLLIQGESGLIFTSGSPDSPAKVGIPITDLVAGSNAVIAILAALRQREHDRDAQFLDVSMLDSIMPWLGYYPHHIWHGGDEPERTGMQHQYITPYGPYRAGDGALVNIAVADDRQWQVLCRDVLGDPGLAEDPRFATVIDRHRRHDVLEPLLSERLAARDAEHWLERLRAAGIPSGRVRTIREALEHPQVVDHGMQVEADSEVGPVPVFRAPFGAARRGRRRIPALGESSAEVLAELGYGPDEIQRLRQADTVG
jgi:crotonobetainyl-CoA:carnitine CoA-transferase CaiB-like acyl-CoA transferase